MTPGEVTYKDDVVRAGRSKKVGGGGGGGVSNTWIRSHEILPRGRNLHPDTASWVLSKYCLFITLLHDLSFNLTVSLTKGLSTREAGRGHVTPHMPVETAKCWWNRTLRHMRGCMPSPRFTGRKAFGLTHAQDYFSKAPPPPPPPVRPW